jgi:hypothetical protein
VAEATIALETSGLAKKFTLYDAVAVYGRAGRVHPHRISAKLFSGHGRLQ